MKLIVDAKALNDALDAPRRLAPRVLLLVAIEGTLAVVADNTIVKVAVRCPADIIESGQACVPASLLFDLAQAMPPGMFRPCHRSRLALYRRRASSFSSRVSATSPISLRAMASAPLSPRLRYSSIASSKHCRARS